MITQQLDTIKTIAQNYFKEGTIIPMEFGFPAFKIDDKKFKQAVVDVMHEKVMYCVERGAYRKMIPDTSYADLVAAQDHIKQNVATEKEKGMGIFCERILPAKIKSDPNMSGRELCNAAIKEICINHMNDSLREIDHLQSFSAPFGELRSSLQQEKTRFVASMIMIKEQLPNVYKHLEVSMPLYQNPKVSEELKQMEANPDISIVAEINKIDPKFANERFPQLMKTVKDLDMDVDGNNFFNKHKIA